MRKFQISTLVCMLCLLGAWNLSAKSWQNEINANVNAWNNSNLNQEAWNVQTNAWNWNWNLNSNVNWANSNNACSKWNVNGSDGGAFINNTNAIWNQSNSFTHQNQGFQSLISSDGSGWWTSESVKTNLKT